MSVRGLIIIENFLNEAEEEWLVEEIESQNWIKNRNGTRDIQIYGPYHNSRYKIIPGKYSKHPDFIKDLIVLLKDRLDIELSPKLGDEQLTEVYINKYERGQKLRQHFDHRSTFEEQIFGISCLSDVVMNFTEGYINKQVTIPNRSLYIMTDDSRFFYKHGIRNPVTETRISVTLRTVRI
jgi:alkylated DNA repair dioxygenase AlkB